MDPQIGSENLQKWLNLPESRDFHGFPIENFPVTKIFHQSEEIIGAMMEHPPVAGAAGSTLPQGREPSDVQAPREPRFQGMSIPGYNMKLAADGKTSWGRYGKMNHLCFAMWPCGHVFIELVQLPTHTFPHVFMLNMVEMADVATEETSSEIRRACTANVG